jgi:hypothetical protein
MDHHSRRPYIPDSTPLDLYTSFLLAPDPLGPSGMQHFSIVHPPVFLDEPFGFAAVIRDLCVGVEEVFGRTEQEFSRVREERREIEGEEDGIRVLESPGVG